jgi:hypothetical protein
VRRPVCVVMVSSSPAVVWRWLLAPQVVVIRGTAAVEQQRELV